MGFAPVPGPVVSGNSSPALMVWDSGISVAENLDLIFREDVSLSVTRVDSLAGSRASLSLARPEASDETLQALLTQADAASAQALSSARIFSDDPSSNWLITEGQALGTAQTTQIIGSGRYQAFSFPDDQIEPGVDTIASVVAIGNTVEITTEQGFEYILSEQGSGVLQSSSDLNSFSITIQRLGRKSFGFALYRLDSVIGSVSIDGQTFTPVQPGYAEAALADAEASGLVFDSQAMPAYGEELKLENIILEAGRDYGVLFFNADKSEFSSSFSAANPGYGVQVQSFLPEDDGQLVYGFEDIYVNSGVSDLDFNDLVLIFDPEPQRPFNQLTVFGDSLSDFGSRAAVLYSDVLYPEAVPPWSGSTFSNAQQNWQTALRTSLDIPYDSTTGAGIANSFIGGPPSTIPASPSNPSYAIGGALSGNESLLQVLASQNPPLFPPNLVGPPFSLDNVGVKSQIEQAINIDQRQLERDLVSLWSGGNNLLAAVSTGQDLQSTLFTILEDTRESLITLLRSGGARSVVVSSLAPLLGEVDGVAYAMPYINALPPEWKVLLDGGAVDLFRDAMTAIVKDVQTMFPYAALIDFNNEYGFNWSRFGSALGNFEDYGVSNTTQSAQGNKTDDPGAYLYFDDVHPTSSGHNMLARSIELTLEAEQQNLDAAKLERFILAEGTVTDGTRFNDDITATANGCQLNGLAGNDRITGLGGADFLNGGAGNDLLTGGGGANIYRGGLGADVFAIGTQSLEGGLQSITDFDASQGDRLLLSEAFADAVGDFFFVPTEQDWLQALSFETTSEGGLLTVRFGDPATVDGVIALAGISSFDTDWLS